ncbi:MAG: hypothetical protein WBA13_05275 [Microcoleaceae cyanobacterium]
MKDDPIVEEVRKIREAYAAQFNFNLKKIYQDLKQQQQASFQKNYRLPAKRI